MLDRHQLLRWVSHQAIRALCRRRGPLYHARIIGGPLRAKHLYLPTLERPSYVFGTYERHIVDTLRQHLGPGDVACDVGAHVGYLSLVMARAVSPNGMVYAFEPDPRSYQALRANVVANGLEHIITPIARAVGSVTARVQLATFDYSLVSHIARSTTPTDAEFVEVDCVKLDDSDPPIPARLIKIDVEGAEWEVLQGAQRTIKQHRPVVISEVRGMDQSWRSIQAFMASLGYTSRVIHGDLSAARMNGLADIVFLPPRSSTASPRQASS